MTTYTVNLTNGDLLATLAPQTTNTTSSSLTLHGQATNNWGEIFFNNLIHMVENFADTSAPLHPLIGQLWYDVPYKVFRVWDGTNWVGFRPDTEPNNSGVTTVLISTSPSIIGLMSSGKLVATISDSTVPAINLPTQIKFRDTNYAFSSRFTSGLGKGITISNDIELNLDNTTNTLVTAKWVSQQDFLHNLISADVTTALGFTPLNPANNLSEVVTDATARTNIGLGSIATQNSSSVTITGGAINGTIIGNITPEEGTFTDISVTDSKTAKFVLAAPAGGDGAPTWRLLTASDVPGSISGPTTIANSNDTGVEGTVVWDTSYIYVCIATDSWKRVAISAAGF